MTGKNVGVSIFHSRSSIVCESENGPRYNNSRYSRETSLFLSQTICAFQMHYVDNDIIMYTSSLARPSVSSLLFSKEDY